MTAKKSKQKKYEDLWFKIRNLIRLITKISDDFDEKYMKIKFNSDDELPLNIMIEVPTITIELFFLKITNIIYRFFLNECLYKI